MKPKVLIVSNCCFSESESNGRTLGNFFIGWPRNNLAQFYTSNSIPDYNLCSNYYCITDADVLRQTLKRKQNNLNKKQKIKEENKKNTGIKRNSLTMILRNLIWSLGLWNKNKFYKWIKGFKPNVVLLQAGDFPYMFKLAYKISIEFNIPLVIYNSEGYYFKKYDYFKSKGFSHLLYPLFYHLLKSNLDKAYKHAKKIIYINDKLRKDYDDIFHSNSITLYTSSKLISNKLISKKDNEKIIISYCGNLSLNRHKSLIEIANCIQTISKDLSIDVYGKAPSKGIENELVSCPGINFHGLVKYDEVTNIITNSDLNLHVESFEEFYKEDLKYAFSTKIADLLSTGKCFLLYAPKNLACTEYLIKNKAAYVVSNKDELYDTLRKIIIEKDERKKYIKNAIKLAQENHDAIKNGKKFENIFTEII